MRWPDGLTRETDLWLDPAESGKPRLRSLRQQPYQIGRMVAAALMLPTPSRQLGRDAASLPVVRRHQYLVTQVGWGNDVGVDELLEQIGFAPNFLRLQNREFSELVGVSSRWQRITTIYGSAGSLPDAIRSHVVDHQTMMKSGGAITPALNRQVDQLMKALESVSPVYLAGHDPLPALESLLDIRLAAVPTLPPPDDIGEDEIEARVEAATEYRLARTRGPSARAFAESIKAAYHHRCAFCGLVLSGIEGLPSGIDAAHILAWSSYDLDVLENGIALCKLHHWAFDAAIMLPVIDSAGNYLVAFTALATRLESAVLARLGTDRQHIPDDWLPSNRAYRPSPRYLRRLYDDLGLAV